MSLDEYITKECFRLLEFKEWCLFESIENSNGIVPKMEEPEWFEAYIAWASQNVGE